MYPRAVFRQAGIDPDEHLSFGSVHSAPPHLGHRIADRSEAQLPSTTLRISPEVHVPVRGQPHPNTAGGSTPPGHQDDRGLQPCPPCRAVSQESRSRPTRKVRGLELTSPDRQRAATGGRERQTAATGGRPKRYLPLAAARCRWLPLANHLQSDTPCGQEAARLQAMSGGSTLAQRGAP